MTAQTINFQFKLTDCVFRRLLTLEYNIPKNTGSRADYVRGCRIIDLMYRRGQIIDAGLYRDILAEHVGVK